jgi:hypothetical protein
VTNPRLFQVNLHDEDEPETPVSSAPRQMHPIPNSPPPSFHSRASSIISPQTRVDPTLADAFDADEDESEDESDDRQRLVRGNSYSVSDDDSQRSGNGAISLGTTTASSDPSQRTPGSTGVIPSGAGAPFRIYGSGIQSDGVFSNLTAKPERGGQVKEEQPPVSHMLSIPTTCARFTFKA